MNRVRAQIICARPQDYAPARVHEAVAYLLARSDTTEDEQQLTSAATAWLQRRQNEPQAAAMKVAGKQKRQDIKAAYEMVAARYLACPRAEPTPRRERVPCSVWHYRT